MSKTWMRFLNLTMALVMALSSMPVTARAEENTCSHTYESVATPASCTAAGVTTYTCSLCGNSYTEAGADATGHSYDAVVTGPTCTAAGFTTYTCGTCGDSYTEAGEAATGHSHTSVVTAPTCTEEGYTTHTCSACGDTYTDSAVEAMGHTFVNGVCTCGEQEQAHSHSYTSVVTAPTCTAAGYTTHTCTCGDSYQDSEVEATGHSYDDGTVKAPTCTADGYTLYTCTVCQETKQENVVKTEGHQYTEEGICSLCSEKAPTINLLTETEQSVTVTLRLSNVEDDFVELHYHLDEDNAITMTEENGIWQGSVPESVDVIWFVIGGKATTEADLAEGTSFVVTGTVDERGYYVLEHVTDEDQASDEETADPVAHVLVGEEAIGCATLEEAIEKALEVNGNVELVQDVTLTDNLVINVPDHRRDNDGNLFPLCILSPGKTINAGEHCIEIQSVGAVFNGITLVATGDYGLRLSGDDILLILANNDINLPCSITGTAQKAIYSTGKNVDIQIYGGTYEAETIVKVTGAGSSVLVAGGSTTFAANSENGAIVVDGESIGVEWQGANITNTAAVAFSLNGDGSTILMPGNFNGTEYGTWEMPNKGAKVQIAAKYCTDMETALAAADNWTEDFGEYITINILDDLTVNQTAVLDHEFPVLVNLGGNTIENASGIKLDAIFEVSQNTMFDTGCINNTEGGYAVVSKADDIRVTLLSCAGSGVKIEGKGTSLNLMSSSLFAEDTSVVRIENSNAKVYVGKRVVTNPDTGEDEPVGYSSLSAGGNSHIFEFGEGIVGTEIMVEPDTILEGNLLSIADTEVDDQTAVYLPADSPVREQDTSRDIAAQLELEGYAVERYTDEHEADMVNIIPAARFATKIYYEYDEYGNIINSSTETVNVEYWTLKAAIEAALAAECQGREVVLLANSNLNETITINNGRLSLTGDGNLLTAVNGGHFEIQENCGLQLYDLFYNVSGSCAVNMTGKNSQLILNLTVISGDADNAVNVAETAQYANVQIYSSQPENENGLCTTAVSGKVALNIAADDVLAMIAGDHPAALHGTGNAGTIVVSGDRVHVENHTGRLYNSSNVAFTLGGEGSVINAGGYFNDNEYWNWPMPCNGAVVQFETVYFMNFEEALQAANGWNFPEAPGNKVLCLNLLQNVELTKSLTLGPTQRAVRLALDGKEIRNDNGVELDTLLTINTDITILGGQIRNVVVDENGNHISRGKSIVFEETINADIAWTYLSSIDIQGEGSRINLINCTVDGPHEIYEGDGYAIRIGASNVSVHAVVEPADEDNPGYSALNAGYADNNADKRHIFAVDNGGEGTITGTEIYVGEGVVLHEDILYIADNVVAGNWEDTDETRKHIVLPLTAAFEDNGEIQIRNIKEAVEQEGFATDVIEEEEPTHFLVAPLAQHVLETEKNEEGYDEPVKWNQYFTLKAAVDAATKLDRGYERVDLWSSTGMEKTITVDLQPGHMLEIGADRVTLTAYDNAHIEVKSGRLNVYGITLSTNSEYGYRLTGSSAELELGGENTEAISGDPRVGIGIAETVAYQSEQLTNENGDHYDSQNVVVHNDHISGYIALEVLGCGSNIHVWNVTGSNPEGVVVVRGDGNNVQIEGTITNTYTEGASKAFVLTGDSRIDAEWFNGSRYTSDENIVGDVVVREGMPAESVKFRANQSYFGGLQAVFDTAEQWGGIHAVQQADLEMTRPAVLEITEYDVNLDLNGYSIWQTHEAEDNQVTDYNMITNKGRLILRGAGEIADGGDRISYENKAELSGTVNARFNTILNMGQLELFGVNVQNGSSQSVVNYAQAYAVDNNSSSGNATVNIGSVWYGAGEELNGTELTEDIGFPSLVTSLNGTAIRQYCASTFYENRIHAGEGTVSGGIELVNPNKAANKGELVIFNNVLKGNSDSALFIHAPVLKSDCSQVHVSINGGHIDGEIEVNMNKATGFDQILIPGELPVFDETGNITDETYLNPATFSVQPADNLVEGGYEAAKDKDEDIWRIREVDYAAKIEDENDNVMTFETVSEALAAAQEGQTVKLMRDSEDGTILVQPGITLDLNGNTLAANHVVGFSGSNVIDSSETNNGLLNIAINNVILSVENEQLSAWDAAKGGYQFFEIAIKTKLTESTEEDRAKLEFYIVKTHDWQELLTLFGDNGAVDNDLSVKVKLTYITAQGNNVDMYYAYPENIIMDMAQQLYGGWGVYSCTLNGINSREKITYSAVLVSGTKVECTAQATAG